MENVLMRGDSPLTPEQWQLVDTTVAQVAQRILVGRRVLDLYGPLGFGAYTVPLYTYPGGGDNPVRAKMVRPLPMTTLLQEFIITVKDLELMNSGQPFDIAPVAAAATQAALAEDRLILHGDAAEGTPGLLNVEGRQVLPLGDWSEEGAALADVGKAIAALIGGNFYGAYAVILHPMRLSQVQRVIGRRGVMEIELLEKQASGGVFVSPIMPLDKVLVLTTQPQYVDLAVGLDLAAGYIETVDLEHRFRLLETLALRVKQAGAICTLGS